jgi:hypothetical protein
MADTRTPYQRYVDYCASIGNTPLTEQRWELFTASRQVHIGPKQSSGEIMRDRWAHAHVTPWTAEELAAQQQATSDTTRSR